MNQAQASVKVKMSYNGNELVIRLLDNPVAADFATLLPLDLAFEDFNRVEKIAYLPRRLSTSQNPDSAETAADFGYFAPWGNIGVFYDGFGGGDEEFYFLGIIESGKEKLAEASSDFRARLEILE